MNNNKNYMIFQGGVSWRVLPGHRHSKLFICRPCKKRADDLLRLSRPQLKMVVAPVRRHLNIMGLFDVYPTCIFCRMETEKSSILSAAARRWLVSAITSLGG
jgi:hypothetical protein